MTFMKDKIIYIRGVGVIGWPLAGLFLSLKHFLPEYKIAIEPYKITAENIYHLQYLTDRGATLVETEENGARQIEKNHTYTPASCNVPFTRPSHLPERSVL